MMFLKIRLAVVCSSLWMGINACDNPSDPEPADASASSDELSKGSTTTGGTGGSSENDTLANDPPPTDSDGEITECPTSGGDWEPSQEIPDASGWEDVTLRGIYRAGGFETFPFTLTACEGTYPERNWCVFWNTRPLRGQDCLANIEVRGRLSEILTPETQCGGLGDHYDRALIVDEVLDVAHCGLGNCDSETEKWCNSNPTSRNCKWPCQETNMETGTGTSTGTDTSSGTETGP